MKLPGSVFQNLRCLEELECGLEDVVLKSDKPILPMTLRTLRLDSGKLWPLLQTLTHLTSLMISYFDEEYWETEPVRRAREDRFTFSNSFSRLEQEWKHLQNLTNLIDFKWNIETDEHERPESLFAHEISSRLPQLRRTSFLFTFPGNILVFQFLETLKVDFRNPEPILELLTVCRQQNKLRFLKKFKQFDRGMLCTLSHKTQPCSDSYL
jgi:hypothetical protein